ncbi:MAG: DUF4097 family beta strand repeat protein [Acidobacteria bacterium]|nr:DUF4097 family beta strand repeat protein [Acidobacteriota bacterium]
MNSRTCGTAFVTASFLILAGCDIEDMDMGATEKEDFHYSYVLKSGGRLELETFNGSVEINGWDKESIEINGTKKARSRDLLDQLKINVVNAPDSVRIEARRPTDRRGNMGVSFVIHAPRKLVLERIASSNGSVRLDGIEGKGRVRTSNGGIKTERCQGDYELTTSNGTIDLADLQGGATARTSNGAIRANGLRGFFEGQTSNGSIDVRIAEAVGKQVRAVTSNGKIVLAIESHKDADVKATTSNGSITVKLPSDTRAQLRAHTSNSSISSDFSVTTTGNISKHHLEGTIGSGGPLVDLSTSNGNIKIARL